jgi:hypothetical protein
VESKAIPIFYRSNLFAPISMQSPSVLLDCLHLSENNPDIATKTVYFTLFHVTYRHDYDSRWMNRLCSILPQSTADSPNAISRIVPVFVSMVDCNFDYSSSPRFKTASRMMLRLGDVRVSSNIVTPRLANQAVSLSLGDMELLVCNSRFPYNFENGHLLNAPAVMKPNDITLISLGLYDETEAEDVFRSMNSRTMFTLASMDARVVVSNGTLTTAEPQVCATLTIGQVCVFACKDSLARFTDSIEEATAEMTAITAETLEAWKLPSIKASFAESAPTNATNSNAQTQQRRESPTKSSEIRRSFDRSRRVDLPRDFLLDGYDWTAIDSDEIGKPGIPPGDEQSARWYGETGPALSLLNSTDDKEITTLSSGSHNNESKCSVNQNGPPIVTHHFNLQPVADPISDGDMGASKYAGSNMQPAVQTRVIVRDLAVRIRFFDGYDWPELLDETIRGAPKCDFFVIPAVLKLSDDCLTSERKPAVGVLSDTAKIDRKSKLMGDLLSDVSIPGSTFADIPLPDEQGKRLKEHAELRRLARRTSKYFQIEASGIVARLDSMKECNEHRLVSCLNLIVRDFFLAESISSDKPVKMIGEWFNEQEHPRDSKDGLILMKVCIRRFACNASILSVLCGAISLPYSHNSFNVRWLHGIHCVVLRLMGKSRMTKVMSL